MFTETTATRKIKAMTKRIRAFPGGTSAGKTIGILLFLIAMAQSDKTPTLTNIVSESFPHLRKGAMRDFLKIMRDHNYFNAERFNKSESIYTFETGSQIEFFSADQPEKLRGGRRDRLFMNECNNIPFATFEELEVRTKEFVLIDWNPVAEFWYYTEVVGKRDDVEELTLTYLDNEALDPQIIASIEKRKNRPDWWKVYGLGQLGELKGQIFTGWDIIDSVPEEARLVCYGLDFGFTNDPTALVAIYKLDGGYVLDEIIYEKGLLNSQIAAKIKAEPRALVVADSAEPKSIAEIKLHGVQIVPAEKGQGSVNAGIDFLKDQKISITKRSVNGIKEYRNYLWRVDRDGKPTNTPEDCWNHFLDCLVAGTIIETSRGRVPVEKIKKGDLVWTRGGLKEVKDSWLVRRNAEVIKLTLSDGKAITATPNHKIWTKNRGWQCLCNVRYGDIMEIWKPRENIASGGITFTQRQNNSIAGNIFTMENFFYIAKFGRIIMEKFRKVFTSTTKTETLSTTELKTSKRLPQVNTRGLQTKTKSRLKKNATVVEKNFYAGRDERQTDFAQINAKVSGGGIKKLTRLKGFARGVKRLLILTNTRKTNTAPVFVVGKVAESQRVAVYDITVAEKNEYFANGVLVHNSARYGIFRKQKKFFIAVG